MGCEGPGDAPATGSAELDLGRVPGELVVRYQDG